MSQLFLFLLFLISCCLGKKSQFASKSAQYKECQIILPASNINMTWFKSVPKWYLPVWGDAETYNQYLELVVGKDNLDKMSPTKKTLACMLCTSYGKKGVTVTAFQEEFETNFNPIFHSTRDGVIDMLFESTFAGTTYILLTNNKSYVLGLDEYADGFNVLWVGSTTPSLSESDYKYIEEEMKRKGYKTKALYKFDYSKCPTNTKAATKNHDQSLHAKVVENVKDR